MNSVPGLAAFSMPEPYTSSTCLPAGSMVTTKSTSVAASSAERRPVTPRDAAWPIFSRTRSKPATSCPFLTRLPAMGSPMLPSPMTPIFAMVLLPKEGPTCRV